MYKAKPKRKLKIVEKPKETPKIKIKISKEQKAKNDKTRKKILEKPKPKPKKKLKIVEKPKPKPKKKLKIVEKKEPRTIGSDLTGLNKKEMNVMGMLELMGRLPVELRKTILDPNVTGVKVAQETIKAENLETGDLDPDDSNYTQIQDNIGESMGYYNDYGNYLTKAELKFYRAMDSNRGGDMTEKQAIKQEKIDSKILEGISNDAYLQIEEQVELYKESIKGTSVTPKQASKGFNDWMDSNYF